MAEDMDTETVRMIRGDPKKALLKLSWPMIISMLLMSANNIIDSVGSRSWIRSPCSTGICNTSFLNISRYRKWNRCRGKLPNI